MKSHSIEPQSFLTIAEMAALSGVSYRTLRFYEERGLLTPKRVERVRYYSHKDRMRLDLIMKGKRLGFSLSEIENLIKGPSIESTDVVSSLTLGKVSKQIAQLAERRESVQTALNELAAALVAKNKSKPD